MSDGRKNNGGHSTKGVAGRKSKAEELKVSAHAIRAIENKFGSIELFFEHIAEQAFESKDHMKMLLEYAFGKPQMHVDHTSKGETIKITFKDAE